MRSWAIEPAGLNSVEREVTKDQGVEPLRSIARPTDEEQPDIIFSPPSVNTEHDNDSSQRQDPYSQVSHEQHTMSYGAGPSSNYSAELHARNSSNPFSNFSSGSRRSAHGDWSSTSSDHGNGQDGIELRPQYAMTDHPVHGSQHLGYESRSIDFSGDTAYHPQNQNVVSPSFVPYDGISRGDVVSPISPIRTPPAPIQVKGEHMQEPRQRGVQLMESYR